ncbi:MAG: alpha-galactosidase [Oscillospiraceae bacterium]|nr:alpha-galactosidase [Oscillospiraceae bacterium]
MKYILHKNGSYDLEFDNSRIINAYPYVDGKPIRPTSIHVGEHKARYDIGGGYIELDFSVDGQALCIDASFEGIGFIHDIEPMGGAELPGLEKVYRQGFGMGGPTGLVDTADQTSVNWTSHGLVALKPGTADATGAWIIINARDHRRFNNVYHIVSDPIVLGKSSVITVNAGFIMECIEQKCALPRMYVRETGDLYEGLRICANEIADEMNARRPARPEFHWCSWYYSYSEFDQERLGEYISGFKEHKETVPFRYLQIDAGYFPSVGDWLLPCHRFPNGMRGPADMIKEAGFGAGIWIGPFMVGDESKLFKEHPDWMLKYKDGSYVRRWKQYNEPKVWGYRDCDYYVLDTSHPGAMAYLKEVFTALRGWGYTLYKTDFMLWSMIDSSEVIRYAPGKTSFDYYRETLEMIRSCIGEDSAWLGCISPFLPSIGYMDMMRIGGDVGAQWEKQGFGPINMIREIVGDSYFNHVYWTNDPDATMLRDFHIHLKPHEIESLALLQAVSGSLITTSDPIHLIAKDRMELLELIVPKGLHDPILPCLDTGASLIIILQKLKIGWLAFFMNPTDQPITYPCDWEKWVGGIELHARKRHGETMTLKDIPYVQILPHESSLYYISDNAILDEPKNLWEW